MSKKKPTFDPGDLNDLSEVVGTLITANNMPDYDSNGVSKIGPEEGSLRYDKVSGNMEYYDGGGWVPLTGPIKSLGYSCKQDDEITWSVKSKDYIFRMRNYRLSLKSIRMFLEKGMSSKNVQITREEIQKIIEMGKDVPKDAYVNRTAISIEHMAIDVWVSSKEFDELQETDLIPVHILEVETNNGDWKLED